MTASMLPVSLCDRMPSMVLDRNLRLLRLALIDYLRARLPGVANVS